MSTTNLINRSSNSSSVRLLAISVIVASSLLLVTSLVMGTYTTTQMAYAQEEEDTTPALVRTTESDINGVEKTTERQSNDKSIGAAAEINQNREHNVDSENAGSAAGDTTLANTWERVIDNPGKGEELIIISGESNEKSSKAASGGNNDFFDIFIDLSPVD